MKLEEIFEEWGRDTNIDRTELGEESLRVPKLHHKYLRFFVREKLALRKLEAEMKNLKLEKHEFYTQGPTKETQEKGWKIPAKGLILKADLPMYMDADPDLVKLSLKIGYQQEKVELLDSIVRTLNNRGYAIKNAIDWARFQAGG